jgi:hypothetical protein
MSLNYWKDIISPSINQSYNTLKYFDVRGFKPYGVINALPIILEGKTVTVEVEIVDASLDYNILLGHSWVYAMPTVVSTLFFVLHFPHQGKIVTIDQLAFFNSNSHIGSVHFVEKITCSSYENVGVVLLKDSTLLGTFPLQPPNISPFFAKINMISTGIGKSLGSYDPWVIPTPN